MGNRILNAIGWLLIALGVVVVVFRLVAGIDLTEGQLLVQDLPWWILVAGCVAGGAAVIHNAQGS